MNISDKYRCIFIHIPKVAGTSIKEALEMPGSGHQPWAFFRENFPEKWHSYESFTVVRNPWDRIVSSYTYARMEKSYWHDKVSAPHPDYELLKDMEFGDFCEVLAGQRHLLKHESWHPQHFWVAGVHEGKTVLMVKNVLKCETLDEDFRRFCKKLGIPALELSLTNTSDHDDYQSYYVDSTRKIIESLYADEIALFGYSF